MPDIDLLNRCVRSLVRHVFAMPANSVRPADQAAPSGAQGEPYATVKIIDCQSPGRAHQELVAETVNGVTTTTEITETVDVFTASINFYRGDQVDAAGIAKYTNAAFTRASRLKAVLQESANVELMSAMGLGLLQCSAPRNLSGLADSTWESRGQIDLTFNVISQERVALAAVASVSLGLNVQEPDGTIQTRTLEVTT